MKLRWPWGNKWRDDATGAVAGSVSHPTAPSDHALALAQYPLGDFLAHNRALLVGAYILVFSLFVVAVTSIGLGAIAEIPHALFGLLRGDQDPAGDALEILKALGHVKVPLWGTAAYLLLQGIILWGCGHVRLTRGPRRPWRPVAAIVAIAALAGLLTVGALGILAAAAITGYGLAPEQSIPNLVVAIAKLGVNPNWTVLWVGWGFWLVIALIYWRGRDPSRILPRLVRALLAGSWIEFGLALPVDIGLRPQAKDCPCATGSYTTLTFAAPVLICLIGPALYLLYRRERELSLAAPGRSTMILLRKSAVPSSGSGEVKVESHVSTARTLSIIVTVLGLLGMQLGMFNSQRGTLLKEARDLIVIAWLRDTFQSDDGLRQKSGGKPLDVDSPFGKISVSIKDTTGASGSPDSISILGIRVERPRPGPVSAKADGQPLPSFSLDNVAWEQRLDDILHSLEIPTTKPSVELYATIRDKIYSRRVKLPGLDFGDFGTEQGAWLVALLCPILLIVLRNAVRQVFRSPDGGAGEPWLILDSETPTERVIGGLWLLGICVSGWLSAFGLIVTVVDLLFKNSASRSPAVAAFAFLAFLVLLILDTWPAMGAVGDLIRLREIRRAARRLAVTPEPGDAAAPRDNATS